MENVCHSKLMRDNLPVVVDGDAGFCLGEEAVTHWPKPRVITGTPANLSGFPPECVH
jgi:hypothetical protein